MMNWEYDLDAEALYIELRDAIIDRQIQVDDRIIIDVDNHGQPVGIEVLSPNVGWDVDAISALVSLTPEEISFLKELRLHRGSNGLSLRSFLETQVKTLDVAISA